MTPYYTALSFINIVTLVMFIIAIVSNNVINHHQRSYFLMACIVSFTIVVLEIVSILVDGAPVKWRWLHLTVSFIGFSILPLVFYSLGKALLPYNNKRMDYFLIVWGVYVGWILFTTLSGNGKGIYYVDAENNYSRGSGFFVHIIFYSFSLVMFVIENVIISIRFWRNRNIVLYINFFFILIGTSVQVFYPDIQVVWVCVIIGIIMYYIYFDDLYQQLDEETYLMNYNSFQKWRRHQKEEVVIVVAEIDNFAKMKLSYDREKIHEIVKEISIMFHDYYKKYGRCYRIGSEEFCVTIRDTKLNFDELNKQFFIDLVKHNFETADMPLVSLGYASLSPKESLNNALTLADSKKRVFIKDRISYLY